MDVGDKESPGNSPRRNSRRKSSLKEILGGPDIKQRRSILLSTDDQEHPDSWATRMLRRTSSRRKSLLADERKRSLGGQMRTPDERKRSLGGQIRTPDERKRSLGGQIRTPDERKRSLGGQMRTPDERKRSLGGQMRTPDERKRSLGGQMKTLDERKKSLRLNKTEGQIKTLFGQGNNRRLSVHLITNDQEKRVNSRKSARMKRVTEHKTARVLRRDIRLKVSALFMRARIQARYDLHHRHLRLRQSMLDTHCKDLRSAYRRQSRKAATKYSQELYRNWDNAEAMIASQCRQFREYEWMILNLLHTASMDYFKMDLNGLNPNVLSCLMREKQKVLQQLKEAKGVLIEPCKRLAKSLEQGLKILQDTSKIIKHPIGEKQRVEDDAAITIEEEMIDKDSELCQKICENKKRELMEIQEAELAEEKDLMNAQRIDRENLKMEQTAEMDSQGRQSRDADIIRLRRLQEVLESKGINRKQLMIRSLIRARY